MGVLTGRSLVRTVVTIAVLGLLAMVGFGDTAPRISDVAERPVVLRVTPCEGDKETDASGVLIDDETVLTVAHAIVQGSGVRVQDHTLGWWPAQVRHIDTDRDLAVLTVPGLRATPLAVAPASGADQVTMLGGFATGTVSGEVLRSLVIVTDSIGTNIETKRRGYELALDIERGDSGAAVIDERGRLVGVIFAQSTRRAGVAWATNISAVPDVFGARSTVVPPC